MTNGKHNNLLKTTVDDLKMIRDLDRAFVGWKCNVGLHCSLELNLK